MRTATIILACLILAVECASAVETSGGPLLVFIHPEESALSAKSVGGAPQDRVEALYMVDPGLSTTAHRIYAGEGNVSVRARPLRNTLLIHSHSRSSLFLLDLATLKERLLLDDTKKKTDYIASDGAIVFFFDVLKVGQCGHKLESIPQPGRRPGRVRAR